MFLSDELNNHLKTSSVIRSQSAVIAEWNMNIASNIQQIGNYRFRPADPTSPYHAISTSFDKFDTNNEFTGATDSDIVVDGGISDNDTPVAFKTRKEKEKLLFSLEECFGKFRPRSGINKLRFFNNRYSHHTHPDMARRPRYYIADRNDQFKYWSSYRTEDGSEYGISNKTLNQQNYISDAAPFVVYKDAVPANRLVVKMQTNVGDLDLGPFNNENGSFDDPFYGENNKTVPVRWKIQYLPVRTVTNTDGDEQQVIQANWVDAISFNPSSLRRNGNPIIGTDGYVELAYGLIVPEEYRDAFYYDGEFTSASLLPDASVMRAGTAYLVKSSDNSAGKIYIVAGDGYASFDARYDWYLNEETINSLTSFTTTLVSPPNFISSSTGQKVYREFQYVGGIRIVAETMNTFDSSLDIIEISPRLSVNLADKVSKFSITKSASDLGVSGLPVGQLLAGTGGITLFDYDQSFFDQNINSIVAKYLGQNIQFKMYEIVSNVNGYDYYIPVKTMYSEGFPEVSSKDRSINLKLRDMFFYLESMQAPQLLIQNASLSYAVSTMLDYIGFSNYSFKRNENEDELIIPYFMVGPDKSVAEILNELAVSAQASMFFDEYNNFIIMSKGYMLPTANERKTDFVLRGSKDSTQNGVIKNNKTSEIANIIDLSSQTNHLYNDGTIQYTTRYIQRSYGSVRQANLVDRDKTWVYKPALLWEVSATESIKTKNDEVSQQQAFVLGAIPLNSDLTDSVPIVSGGKVINNVIDLGEAVYWLPRYSGYLYANGEVIKFDAIQFSVPGLTEAEILALGDKADGDNVWITSTQEYQRYFSKIPFNGKIYPTGLVRIYSEPNYETVNGLSRLKDGAVAKHGRAQFGTGLRNTDGTMSPVYHHAGLNTEWTSSERLRGIDMEVKYLFGTQIDKTATNVFSEFVDRGATSITGTYPQEIQVTFTGATNTDTKINAIGHGLKVGDTIYFSSSNTLPTSILRNSAYFVVGVSADYFTFSEVIGGDAIQLTTEQLTAQVPPHSCVLSVYKKDLTGVSASTDIPSAIFTKTAHGLVDGQIIYPSSSGTTSLPQNLFFTVTVSDEDTFSLYTLDSQDVITSTAGTVDFKVYEYPAIVELAMHRFAAGDPITFSGTSLPDSITAGTTYYVSSTALSPSSFMLAASLNGDKITISDNVTYFGDVSLNYKTLSGNQSMTKDQWELVRLYVPDVSFMSVGLTVEVTGGTGIVQPETKIVSIDSNHNFIVLDKPVTKRLSNAYVDPETSEIVINSIRAYEKANTVDGVAGKTTLANETTRNGVIKNFLSNIYVEESSVNRMLSTQAGTVQSSAFVMNGYQDSTTPSLLSYVYKPLEDRFVHFGTRMRIIGKIDNNEYRGQSPDGAKTYYTASGLSPEQTTSIGGASGGIGIMINPETNNGYYFEIAALTANNVTQYTGASNLHNLLFYKIERNAEASSDTDKAIPVKLWGGTGEIITDDGRMTGQYRLSSDKNTSVYDVAVEYEKIGGSLRFYLYLNNVLVGVVDDESPLEVYNNMALFTRSSSRVMFENVYALTNNYSQNTTFGLGVVPNSVFADLEVNASESFRKYALSGLVQSTYLSGISAIEPPKYNIYFEEFGTIMREAAYFNVRYDKAYPALYATISPTFNRVKGYTVSGFTAGAYKAEFLVFNSTDAALNLDSTSGNYLRIQGITFTQQSPHELSVDEYYSKRSDPSDPQFSVNENITSLKKEEKVFQDIKFSRMTYGKKQFSLTSSYIQNQDEANSLMGWLSEKIMKPRKSIGVKVFGLPTVQLGDIAEIDYTNSDGVNEISESGSRFVVYNIEYGRGESGPETTMFLSEVGQ